MSKEGCHCTCLSGIIIDSVAKRGINYYAQVFLEEWKYSVKGGKQIIRDQ